MTLRGVGTVALSVSVVLFAAFFANVLIGAMRWGTVLEDVFQMLLLFASSVAFVVGILAREAEPTRETD